MYHPYFRGKQYELITVREKAELLAATAFVPIIEPVKESLGGLRRALSAVRTAGGAAVVVVNPYHGVHAEDGGEISALLSGEFSGARIAAGILLSKDTDLDEAGQSYALHQGKRPIYVIHAGYPDAKAVADTLGGDLTKVRHVFFERYCGKLYRKHFAGAHRVLLRDGFQRRRNRDHPDVELFSDLHVTFREEGMDGFGDFLIVGDEFSESGGPAYAVAIHLTFIDDDQDNAMFIYHFKSTRVDTPTDPAGKFAEALDAMIDTLNSESSKVLETSAVREFRELHKARHFPGLGYVKKLSMNHHVETLAHYFAGP